MSAVRHAHGSRSWSWSWPGGGGRAPHPILSMSLISFGKVQERAKCILYKKTLPMGIWEALTLMSGL